MQPQPDPLRPLKLATVLNLGPRSVQARTGDAVNLFALSGFLDNSYSAQTDGSFTGAHAMNFLVLYYSE